MMHDNSEDKMFKDLLGDYAAPADDDGFSAALLANLPAEPNPARIKSLLVGSAAAVGGAIAMMQVPALWTYLKGVSVPKLPTPSAPAIDFSALDSTGLMSSSYGIWVFTLGALMALWIGKSVLLGDDA